MLCLLGADQVLRYSIPRVCILLYLAGEVAVSVESQPLLRPPSLAVQDRVALRDVVHVLGCIEAADELGLSIVQVRVGLAYLRSANVSVVYEKVGEGCGDCAVQHGEARDAVGWRNVLVYLHVVFQHVAILSEAYAVLQYLGLVIVRR